MARGRRLVECSWALAGYYRIPLQFDRSFCRRYRDPGGLAWPGCFMLWTVSELRVLARPRNGP